MIMTRPTTSPGRECSRGDKVGDRSSPECSSSPDNSVRPSSSSSFPGVRLPVRSVETDEGVFGGSMIGAISPTQGQSSR